MLFFLRVCDKGIEDESRGSSISHSVSSLDAERRLGGIELGLKVDR